MTRAESLKETIRALTVAELRRRSSQKLIEGEYLSGASITRDAVNRRNAMEAQIENLKAKLVESVEGLTSRELDAMATEIEGLR
jgi:hypothetical protein